MLGRRLVSCLLSGAGAGAAAVALAGPAATAPRLVSFLPGRARRIHAALCQQLVGGVDHDGAAVLQAHRSAESDPGAAVEPGDVGPPVEHGCQLAGRVRDLGGEHGVLLDRADLDREYATLDGCPAWLGQ